MKIKQKLRSVIALLLLCATTVNITGCDEIKDMIKKDTSDSDRRDTSSSAIVDKSKPKDSKDNEYSENNFIRKGNYYFYAQTGPDEADLEEVCVSISKLGTPDYIGGYEYEYTYSASLTSDTDSNSTTGYVYFKENGDIQFSPVFRGDIYILNYLNWEHTSDGGYVYKDSYITSTVSRDRSSIEWHSNYDSGNSSELSDAISLYTGIMREHCDVSTALSVSNRNRGLIFYFEDVTDDSCRVVWDSYAYVNYNGYTPSTDCPLNSSYYGSQKCSYKFVETGSGCNFSLILNDLTAEYKGNTYYLRITDMWSSSGVTIELSPSPNEATSGCIKCYDFEVRDDSDAEYLRFASDNTKFNASDVKEVPYDAVEFNGHNYKFYEISLSWNEAESYCEELGGHLASVGSSDEQMFLEDLTAGSNKENIWIGGYFSEEDWAWRWTDGSLVTYSNWDVWYDYKNEAFWQPDNYTGDEYYIRYANKDISYEEWYANRGGWNDTPNSSDGYSGDAPLSSFGFVCEWS